MFEKAVSGLMQSELSSPMSTFLERAEATNRDLDEIASRLTKIADCFTGPTPSAPVSGAKTAIAATSHYGRAREVMERQAELLSFLYITTDRLEQL